MAVYLPNGNGSAVFKVSLPLTLAPFSSVTYISGEEKAQVLTEPTESTTGLTDHTFGRGENPECGISPV